MIFEVGKEYQIKTVKEISSLFGVIRSGHGYYLKQTPGLFSKEHEKFVGFRMIPKKKELVEFDLGVNVILVHPWMCNLVDGN